MPFSVKTSAGTTVILDNGDKVTNAGGILTELYITEIIPIGIGMGGKPRVLFPSTVTAQKYSGFNQATQAIDYDASVSLIGQYEPAKVQEWNTADGPQIRRQAAAIVFNEASATAKHSAFKAVLGDTLSGLFVADQFTVELVTTVLVGGDDDIGVPAIEQSQCKTVNPVLISLTDQYSWDGIHREFVGNAKIILKQADVSQAELEQSAYIQITPAGLDPMRFTIWKSGEGIRREQTAHWCVYLQRMV